MLKSSSHCIISSGSNMATVRWQVLPNGTVKEYHKIVVHQFHLSDFDDPDLHAAEPIYQWEKSEPGQFVMMHSVDKPIWKRCINHMSYGYDYIVIAELEMQKLSEFYLKWGKNGNI